MHGITDSNIEIGDSLTNPKFIKNNALAEFDLILANPPWNQDGYDEKALKTCKFWKEIYSYGFTTSQSADWAWIQLMLAYTNKKGKLGIVMDNGALFRSGREANIRKGIIENDLLECVILLPEKLFYNTSAPGAIIILNKNKKPERKNKILFINASQEFGKHPDVRKLNTLKKEHIDNISGKYHEFKKKKGIAGIVPLKDIRENDYNLNVTLYVYPEEEIEEIDVMKEWKELKQMEKESAEVEQKLEKYLKEIY